MWHRFEPFSNKVSNIFPGELGHLSRELAPYAKSIVGVDISQGMVDQYNKRVSDQGIPPEEMKAVRAHLKGIEGELDNAKFDVVIVCVFTTALFLRLTIHL